MSKVPSSINSQPAPLAISASTTFGIIINPSIKTAMNANHFPFVIRKHLILLC